MFAKKLAKKPPLQKIYDPNNGAEDLMEIDLIALLQFFNLFTYILTVGDGFSPYLFAVPLRKPDTESIVNVPSSLFQKHAYVPKHILTVKGTVLTAELMELLTETAGKVFMP